MNSRTAKIMGLLENTPNRENESPPSVQPYEVKIKKRWFCNRPLSPLYPSNALEFRDSVVSSYNEEIIVPYNKSMTNNINIIDNIVLRPPLQERNIVSQEEVHKMPDRQYPISSTAKSPPINSPLCDSDLDLQYSPVYDSDLDPPYSPEDSDEGNRRFGKRKKKYVGNISNMYKEISNESTSLSKTPALPKQDTCDLMNEGHVSSKPEYLFKQKLDSAKPSLLNTKKKIIRERDLCFYCETEVLNFARHLKRNHPQEIDVQQIFSKPIKSIERKQLITTLRKRGNFLKSASGFKPMKKPNLPNTSFLPCIHCLGFYSSKQLFRHRKICTENANKVKSTCSDSQNKLIAHLKIDSQLKERVFPHMRADKISLVAKRDPLICAFGARYIKQHREKHFVNVASRKMRELAKVLIEIRKLETSVCTMFDALQPKYFDLFVEATKVIGKYQTEKDVFDSPTFAMNISTTLKQCCDIAINFALKKQGCYENIETAEAQANLKTMIHLFNANWRFEISTQAANDLNLQKWNKVTIIPLANDLRLLRNYFAQKANEAVSLLTKEKNNKIAYTTLLETVFCRVILLNRKRPGELQRMRLHTYENSKSDKSTYQEFHDVISPAEKILIKKFKRVVIKGKRGRGVPVLFSTDVQDHINKLNDVRSNFVNPENPYLFANANLKLKTPILGYKVLQKFAKACGAKNPDALTCTRLRKHLATLTQMFNLNENEIEQLASFMGHTINVHKNSYRLPDDLYQTAKISKLLLLMESGNAGNYKGRALDEIDLNLEENLLSGDEDNVSNDDIIEYEADPVPSITNNTSTSTKTVEQKGTASTKKRCLIPWTEEQKNIVKQFFRLHIKKRQPPKRRECEELINQNPEILHNKDWLKIKVFIQNVYTKKSK